MAVISFAYILLFTLIKANFSYPIVKEERRTRFLTNVELSSLLTCLPGSKFRTISSFLNFNTEATCDDVSLINSDTSANGSIGFETIQIPLSAVSPFHNRQIRDGFFPVKTSGNNKDPDFSKRKKDQEVNGTISYGRCSDDNMLSEHVSLGDAGSCSLERKVARLSTIFSMIRIRGKCESFCTGITTIRLSPNIN